MLFQLQILGHDIVLELKQKEPEARPYDTLLSLMPAILPLATQYFLNKSAKVSGVGFNATEDDARHRSEHVQEELERAADAVAAETEAARAAEEVEDFDMVPLRVTLRQINKRLTELEYMVHGDGSESVGADDDDGFEFPFGPPSDEEKTPPDPLAAAFKPEILTTP